MLDFCKNVRVIEPETKNHQHLGKEIWGGRVHHAFQATSSIQAFYQPKRPITSSST